MAVSIELEIDVSAEFSSPDSIHTNATVPGTGFDVGSNFQPDVPPSLLEIRHEGVWRWDATVAAVGAGAVTLSTAEFALGIDGTLIPSATLAAGILNLLITGAKKRRAIARSLLGVRDTIGNLTDDREDPRTDFTAREYYETFGTRR